MRKLTKGLPCIDCGKPTSGIEHKRCLRCVKKYQVGQHAANWKGVDYRCKDCNKQLKNIYATRCQSCAKLGKRNSHFGISATHTKYISYKNIYFHSGWEANFAKWCDGSGIKWKYEPKAFNLGNTTYTPDFYLQDFNCYIEIKGLWYKYAIKKFRLFKNKYPKINIMILNKKKLKRLNIINKSG